MKYRFITGGAVLLAWVLVYLLNLTNNWFAILIPVAVLAVFQIKEKRIRKIFKI
jgi:uncharacterized membrane protein YgaE (UPF0421/DUF939 family)